MSGRTFSSDSYRYGFNGKENDRNWGTKWIQDYGFRLYNPSIGRFLSVDPLAPDYPWYTPYQFAGNKPIKFIDLDGREEAIYPNYYGRGGVLVKWSEKEFTYSVNYSIHKIAHYRSIDGGDFQLIQFHEREDGDEGKFFGTTPLYMFTTEGEFDPRYSSDLDKLAFFLGYFDLAQDVFEIGPLTRIVGTAGKAVNKFFKNSTLSKRQVKKLARQLDADGGHSYGRHGAHTTDKQHEIRLKTGRAPDGSKRKKPPKSSSKFGSHSKHLEAAGIAIQELTKKNKIDKKGLPLRSIKVHFEYKNAGVTFKLDNAGNITKSKSNYVEGFFTYDKNTGKYKLNTLYPTNVKPKNP